MQKPGKNQEDIQGLNRALVLQLIHRLRVCSRAELARRTGLTRAAITGITQQLLDCGMVRETGLLPGGGGRRSIGLTLCQEKYLCIGLRLTRRHIRGGLFDAGGELYEAQECRLSPVPQAQDALARMREIISALLEAAAGRRVLGVGLAAPGPVLHAEGRIAYMSAFPGWEGVSIPAELEKYFHLPVLLEHDGACCALAEWWNRPPQEECRMMVCVLAGQGVGAGILSEGRPVRGALGCAGELGHMSLNPLGPRCDCGNRGCLEGYVSSLALEREMAQALQKRREHPLFGASARQILAAVEQGDPLAREIFEKQAEYLGFGLVNLVNLLNPDCLILSDELAQCAGPLEETVRRVLKARLSPRIYEGLRLSVRPGSPYQIMQAASALVLDRFLREPEFGGRAAFINA